MDKSDRLKVYEVYGDKEGFGRESYGYQVGKGEKDANNRALKEFRQEDTRGEKAFFDPKFSAVEVKVKGFRVFAEPIRKPSIKK